MFSPDSNTAAKFALALLIHYSFDLGGYTAFELIDCWLKEYPANWVRLAVIEALYQGRYKAVSVKQILASWQRRDQTLYHFNHEFERLVCGNFLPMLPGQPDTKANASPVVQSAVNLNNRHNTTTVAEAQQGAEQQKPVQLVNASAEDRRLSNQISETAQKNSYQVSENNQTLRSAKRTSLASHTSDKHRPIEQFTPDNNGSDFYTKLKAIAQRRGNASDEGTRQS